MSISSFLERQSPEVLLSGVSKVIRIDCEGGANPARALEIVILDAGTKKDSMTRVQLPTTPDSLMDDRQTSKHLASL